MKLGILLRTAGAVPTLDMDMVLEAERLGYESAWAGEAYGADAVTPIAWMLARTTRIKGGTGIMQMPARTPAMAAMTAMTLAQLSNNRFIVGVGASGPQVVEGWHGVGNGRPPVVQLLGNDAISQLQVAKSVAAALGLNLHRIGGDAIPTSVAEQETLVRLWQRESVLLPVGSGLEVSRRTRGLEFK